MAVKHPAEHLLHWAEHVCNRDRTELIARRIRLAHNNRMTIVIKVKRFCLNDLPLVGDREHPLLISIAFAQAPFRRHYLYASLDNVITRVLRRIVLPGGAAAAAQASSLAIIVRLEMLLSARDIVDPFDKAVFLSLSKGVLPFVFPPKDKLAFRVYLFQRNSRIRQELVRIDVANVVALESHCSLF